MPYTACASATAASSTIPIITLITPAPTTASTCAHNNYKIFFNIGHWGKRIAAGGCICCIKKT